LISLGHEIRALVRRGDEKERGTYDFMHKITMHNKQKAHEMIGNA
jgi:hypothetical protein